MTASCYAVELLYIIIIEMIVDCKLAYKFELQLSVGSYVPHP